MTRLADGATGIALLAALGGGCFLVVGDGVALIDGRVLSGAVLLGAGVLVLLGGRRWARRIVSLE
jgi:hypothetical protein